MLHAPFSNGQLAGLEILLRQKLCNLYCVQGSTLAYVVSHYPKVEPIFNGSVLSDSAHQGLVDTRRMQWHWINSFIWIVHHSYPWGLNKQNSGFFGGNLPFGLDVHGLRVTIEYRDPHGGRAHPDGLIFHYFLGFMDHFHFFFSIAIFEKTADVGEAVEGNSVWINLRFGFLKVE